MEELKKNEQPVLKDGLFFVPSKNIEQLSYAAFSKNAFFFRQSHLKLLCDQVNDEKSSPNDIFVIKTLLDNASVAANGEFCICQDCGTACIYVWQTEGTISEASTAAAIMEGVKRAYSDKNLRASILKPMSFFEEQNTKTNLPAQIVVNSVYREKGSPPYMRFLFMAKGAGSANLTGFWTMSKALLQADAFDKFLRCKISSLGTSACPPYRLSIVVGGLSPEQNLEVLKLSSAELFDSAPSFAPETAAAKSGGETEEYGGAVFRDKSLEDRAMEIARKTGHGAQAGGKALLLDARVLRLPRHAASLFVSIGVSCCAHRNILGIIDENGMWAEKLEEAPLGYIKAHISTACRARGEAEKRFARQNLCSGGGAPPAKIILNGKSIPYICEEIRSIMGMGNKNAGNENAIGGNENGGERKIICLSGKIITARDAAHLKWHSLIEAGKPLPEYLLEYPVFYAGPAGTPKGRPCGSIGPTSAGRMDVYANELFSRGASLITIAKGQRSAAFYAECEKWGALSLNAIGGAAALIACDNIISAEVIDYPELLMEAVRLLEVKDLAVFI